jgi:hypothetical protein
MDANYIADTFIYIINQLDYLDRDIVVEKITEHLKIKNDHCKRIDTKPAINVLKKDFLNLYCMGRSACVLGDKIAMESIREQINEIQEAVAALGEDKFIISITNSDNEANYEG